MYGFEMQLSPKTAPGASQREMLNGATQVLQTPLAPQGFGGVQVEYGFHAFPEQGAGRGGWYWPAARSTTTVARTKSGSDVAIRAKPGGLKRDRIGAFERMAIPLERDVGKDQDTALQQGGIRPGPTP